MRTQTIQWVHGAVRIIDQTRLPHKLKYINCQDVKTLWEAIRVLKVRGAPALGVAAGFGVLLGIQKTDFPDTQSLVKKVFDISHYLEGARPTAVNLFNALERIKRVAMAHCHLSVKELKALIEEEAFRFYEEDRAVCRAMGKFGGRLIKNGTRVLTVCNAGALATVDYGTALGVMYNAKEKKKRFQVYACETRPLLQGARLTTWELSRAKIDTTLICDNMAATLMKQNKVDIIFTGADRIAANGDAANKIGTYNLAVLAKHHKVPFYIVAPYSTFDLSIVDGNAIPIEERDPDEVRGFGKVQTAPANIAVYNPAFDVTESKLITGIITEYGIIQPVNRSNIKRIFKKKK
jgi:methylthioribose-1-phosphate isomerase